MRIRGERVDCFPNNMIDITDYLRASPKGNWDGIERAHAWYAVCC